MAGHRRQGRLARLINGLRSYRRRQKDCPVPLGPATAYGGRTGAWMSVDATRSTRWHLADELPAQIRKSQR